MNNDDSVDHLIEQLRSLRVREAVLIQRIATRQAQETRTAASPIVPQIDTTSHQQVEHTTNSFKTGDSIFITNAVRLPHGTTRRRNHGDYHGTVTRTSSTRVYFSTQNGTDTNRLPKNLRIIANNKFTSSNP